MGKRKIKGPKLSAEEIKKQKKDEDAAEEAEILGEAFSFFSEVLHDDDPEIKESLATLAKDVSGKATIGDDDDVDSSDGEGGDCGEASAKKSSAVKGSNDGDSDDGEDSDEDSDDGEEESEDDGSDSSSDDDDDVEAAKATMGQQPPAKRVTPPTVSPIPAVPAKTAKPKKAPPKGYMCKACKESGHWLYDCAKYLEAKKKEREDKAAASGALKATMKKAQVGDAEVGPAASADPEDASQAKNKVFVQGLPFDMTKHALKKFFEDELKVTVKACSIICFEDSKRCKGMAYVSFSEHSSAEKALVLNGKKLGDSGRWLSVTAAKIKGGGRAGGGGGAGKACFRCGKRGHTPAACDRKRVCYKCQSLDHLSSACPAAKKI